MSIPVFIIFAVAAGSTKYDAARNISEDWVSNVLQITVCVIVALPVIGIIWILVKPYSK